MRNQILVSKYYSPIKVNRGSLEKLDYKIAIMKIQDWIGDSLASVKKKGDDFEKKKRIYLALSGLNFVFLIQTVPYLAISLLCFQDSKEKRNCIIPYPFSEDPSLEVYPPFLPFKDASFQSASAFKTKQNLISQSSITIQKHK